MILVLNKISFRKRGILSDQLEIILCAVLITIVIFGGMIMIFNKMKIESNLSSIKQNIEGARKEINQYITDISNLEKANQELNIRINNLQNE